MNSLSQKLKNVAIALTMLWITMLSIVGIGTQNIGVNAKPLSILVDPPGPGELTYGDFKSVGIPDSDYYIPKTTGTPDSTISNNCVRRGIPTDGSLSTYGNIQNGSQEVYNTGNDRLQAAFFCKFWPIWADGSPREDRCAASSFIDKFNNPLYKQDTDIIPTDEDIRQCIQFVRVGDRCLLTGNIIKAKPHTVVDEKGAARQVYSGFLSEDIFGGAADIFYCDLAGNSDKSTEGLGGTIQVIDARCEGNPNFQKNGVQICLRGRFVGEMQLKNGANNANTAYENVGERESRLVANTDSNSGVVQAANVQKANWFTDWIGKAVGSVGDFVIKALFAVIAGLFMFIFMVMYMVADMIANVINFVILVNPASDNFIGISREISTIVSSIGYLMIIIAVAGTGVMYVFKGRNAVGQITEVLMMIAIVTIGINFAFYLAAAMVALSYQIGYIFSAGIISGAGEGYNVANIFSSYNKSIIESYSANIDINGNFANIISAFDNAGFSDMMNLAFKYLVLILILGFLIYVYFTLLRTLAVRVAVLFLLLISSPIGFVMKFSNFGPFKKAGEKWFDTLISYSISYPLIVILLAFGIVLNIKIGRQLDSAFIVSETFSFTEGLKLSDLSGKAVNYFVPIMIKVALTLGILMLIKQIIDEHLMPFVNQVNKATSQAISGANRFAKSSVKNLKTAGKVAAVGVGAGFATANAARRAIGNIGAASGQFVDWKKIQRPTLKGIKENGLVGETLGFLMQDAGTFKTGSRREKTKRALKNLAGLDADVNIITPGENGEWWNSSIDFKGRTSRNGAVSMLSAGSRGYQRGLKFAETNRLAMGYKGLVRGIRGNREFDRAGALANMEMDMRSRATDQAQIAEIDEWARKNGLQSDFFGLGATEMAKVTDDQKKLYRTRQESKFRNKFLAPGASENDNDARFDLISGHREKQLNFLAQQRHRANYDDLTVEEKQKIAATVDERMALDGFGNAAVKDAIDTINKNMTNSDAGNIRADTNLSALWSSPVFQRQLFTEARDKKKQAILKKAFGLDTLGGFIHPDSQSFTWVETHLDSMAKSAINRPENVERANMESEILRNRIEKELKKTHADDAKVVATYTALGLNGAKFMDDGAMTRVSQNIKDTAGRDVVAEKAANAAAGKLFVSGMLDAKLNKEWGQKMSKNQMDHDDVMDEKRDRLLASLDDGEIDSIKNIIDANPGATDAQLATLIKNHVASLPGDRKIRSDAFGEGEVAKLRTGLMEAGADDNIRKAVVAGALKPVMSVDMKKTLEQENVQGSVQKMIEEVMMSRPGATFKVQEGGLDFEFNDDHALTSVSDFINKKVASATEGSKLAAAETAAQKMLGEEGASILMKEIEKNGGVYSPDMLTATTERKQMFRDHIQRDGYAQSIKDKVDEVKRAAGDRGGEALVDFHHAALNIGNNSGVAAATRTAIETAAIGTISADAVGRSAEAFEKITNKEQQNIANDKARRAAENKQLEATEEVSRGLTALAAAMGAAAGGGGAGGGPAPAPQGAQAEINNKDVADSFGGGIVYAPKGSRLSPTGKSLDIDPTDEFALNAIENRAYADAADTRTKATLANISKLSGEDLAKVSAGKMVEMANEFKTMREDAKMNQVSMQEVRDAFLNNPGSQVPTNINTYTPTTTSAGIADINAGKVNNIVNNLPSTPETQTNYTPPVSITEFTPTASAIIAGTPANVQPTPAQTSANNVTTRVADSSAGIADVRRVVSVSAVGPNVSNNGTISRTDVVKYVPEMPIQPTQTVLPPAQNSTQDVLPPAPVRRDEVVSSTSPVSVTETRGGVTTDYNDGYNSDSGSGQNLGNGSGNTYNIYGNSQFGNVDNANITGKTKVSNAGQVTTENISLQPTPNTKVWESGLNGQNPNVGIEKALENLGNKIEKNATANTALFEKANTASNTAVTKALNEINSNTAATAATLNTAAQADKFARQGDYSKSDVKANASQTTNSNQQPTNRLGVLQQAIRKQNNQLPPVNSTPIRPVNTSQGNSANAINPPHQP